ncbi:hypothetical protein LR48_Vigan03g248100 [Vigna angularis]|uniref:Uncharacterized protein n=2 Tax=Phaseolus angularis TaxID=3914 RepID=A0A0L9U9B6_PHAAN|nr:hypothetical protein LR48_Vigan03g248100 [Vigna angularis]
MSAFCDGDLRKSIKHWSSAHQYTAISLYEESRTFHDTNSMVKINTGYFSICSTYNFIVETWK